MSQNIVKLSNVKDKKCQSTEKAAIPYMKGSSVRLTVFSSSQQQSPEKHGIFRMLKENSHPQNIIYQAKLVSKTKEKIMLSYLDNNKGVYC